MIFRRLFLLVLWLFVAFVADAQSTNKISDLPRTNTTQALDDLLLNSFNGSGFSTRRQGVGQFGSNLVALLSLVNSNSQVAAINSASNALASLITSGGQGDVTVSQLNAASNALVTLSRSQDTTTSNALVSLAYGIGGNATNYTSAVSNALHGFWLSGSNTLAGLISAVGAATNAQPSSTNLSWLHASLQATNPFAFSIWPSNVWGLSSGAPLFVYRQGPRVYLSGSITNSSSWGIYDELGAYPAPYAPQRGVRLVGLRYGGSPLSQTGGAETYLNAGAGRIYNLNDGGGTAQFIAFESSWPAASPFHAITNGGGGQVVLLIPDPAPTNGVTLAVYCHGFGQDAGQWAFDGNSLVALTNGFPVLSVSGGPSTWGNETNVVAFSNALRWVKSSFAVTNTVVFGGSMGGLTALNLMNRFPEISRFYGLYPVCSLTNAAWSGSLSNSVKGAYGYTSPSSANYITTAFPSDPAALSVTNWAGKRFWFVASSGDTLVPPAQHSNVMTNRIISGGGSVHYYSHTGYHGDPSAYVPTNIVSFLRGVP